MTNLHRELCLAHQALDLASPMLRDATPGHLTAKDDRDVATETDFAIERHLREFLTQQTPHIGFLGEEEGHAGNHDRYWVLDPIDGTANFTHHMPLCAISLALIEGDTPVLGAIDLPHLNSRYSAHRDGGAHHQGQRITASSTTTLHNAIVAIGDYAVGHGRTAKNHQRLTLTAALAENTERVRMLGAAAIDLAWVAHGHLDASITLANKPWDTAAGVLIAREAGATVLDLDGTPHTIHSQATIAAPQTLIDNIIRLVNDTLTNQTQDNN